jgi:CubicO group peptidase (beta-lactamase class C family)
MTHRPWGMPTGLRGCLVSIFVAATGCVGGPATHTPDSRAVERADSLMLAFVNGGEGPGCALAIARGGTIRHERGFGMAVIEHGIPIDERTTFDIGSVGKQFTAAAVLRLAADKRLSLDDALARWIPGLAPAVAAVRVRDLLQHTSGVRDYGGLGMVAGTHPRTMPEFLALMRRQRGLNFAPGSQHEYSHSDYTLLAAVVEAAVGMPYMRWVEDSLFRPAGLLSTRVLGEGSTPVAGLALAYERDSNTVRTRFPGGVLVGGDNTYTSAGDLLRWDLALDAGKVIPATIAATLRTELTLDLPHVAPYAHGRWFARHNGHRMLYRNGGGGFSTSHAYFPEAALAVAVLCNGANMNPFRVALQVADGFLPSRPVVPDTAAQDADILTGEVARLVGRYQSWQVPWDPLRFVAHEGRLYELWGTDSTQLRRRRDGRWDGEEAIYAFSGDSAGRATTITMERAEGYEVGRRISDVPPLAPTGPALARYAGDWFSQELVTRWTTVVRGDTLWLERPGEEGTTMEYLGGRAFRASVTNGAGLPSWVGMEFPEGGGRPTRLIVGTHPAPFELVLGVTFERLR